MTNQTTLPRTQAKQALYAALASTLPVISCAQIDKAEALRRGHEALERCGTSISRDRLEAVRVPDNPYGGYWEVVDREGEAAGLHVELSDIGEVVVLYAPVSREWHWRRGSTGRRAWRDDEDILSFVRPLRDRFMPESDSIRFGTPMILTKPRSEDRGSVLVIWPLLFDGHPYVDRPTGVRFELDEEERALVHLQFFREVPATDRFQNELLVSKAEILAKYPPGTLADLGWCTKPRLRSSGTARLTWRLHNEGRTDAYGHHDRYFTRFIDATTGELTDDVPYAKGNVPPSKPNAATSGIGGPVKRAKVVFRPKEPALEAPPASSTPAPEAWWRRFWPWAAGFAGLAAVAWAAARSRPAPRR